jgi:hypothetical protein
LTWFVGFAEGDGCTSQAHTGRLRFEIGLHSCDLPVLELIQSTLGFGKIYSSRVNVSSYVVSDREGLFLICLLLNGNVVLPVRHTKLVTFIEAYNVRYGTVIVPKPDTVWPTLDDCWILGFTDAEGCFHCSLSNHTNAFHFSFSLGQKWASNAVILEHMASLFGVGTVRENASIEFRATFSLLR